MDEESKHVQREKEEEEHKVLVVAVANAVVDECAVVVEPLDALVAVVAVPSFLGSQVLTLDAHVIKVKRFFHDFLQDLDEVFSLVYIAGINQA